MLKWREYGIEAACLGTFMVSACLFGTLLGYPGSPVVQALPDPLARRVLMGLAMGATAAVLIYSPFGKRSGAHMNPATTLTFFRLGRVAARDAAGYVIAQFAGGMTGVGLAVLALGSLLAHPEVRYVVTQPGESGILWAFAAEAAMTFVLMSVVLRVSNHARWNRYTGMCAAFLVFLYIVIEAPVSGMSMNPARTWGSAYWAGDAHGLWIYFTAPFLGMLLAAEVFIRRSGLHQVLCAKLHHMNDQPCPFICNFGDYRE